MRELSAEQQQFVADLTSHQPAIRNLCRILMPGNSNDLEDIVQETNRVILEKATTFVPGTNFKAWAFSITRFQVLAFQKRVSRNRVIFDGQLIQQLSQAATEAPAEQARQSLLAECISQLKAEDQSLLRTRYSHHGSLAQYAEKVGRTMSSLKRALARLREQLRECTEKKLMGTDARDA